MLGVPNHSGACTSSVLTWAQPERLLPDPSAKTLHNTFVTLQYTDLIKASEANSFLKIYHTG